MNGINNTRLEEFRQLRKEIRGADNYLIVGIDIAKQKHHAFFGTANGKTLHRRLVFDNRITGFEKLLVLHSSLMAQNALAKAVFGMEPTANYHKPLADFLVEHGHMVVLVSANATKKNRELLDGRWDKNDTKDAANVADLISQGKCLYYDYPSEDVRELRTLLSLKRRLKKQEHSIQMRIRNHLIAQYFPEFDRHYGQGRQENLAIVKWCLDPERLSEMEFNKFYQMVTTRDRGIKQSQRLQAIHEEAKNSIGCSVGPSAIFEAKMMAEALSQIRETIEATEKRVVEICNRLPEYKHILSIPGFGPVISAMTLGAIGNPFRFTNSRQVVKMAGLDLSAGRSGENSEKATAKLSKRGKAELRYGLYQAALIASVQNNRFIEYFASKLRGREREKGIKTKMRVKLAAKMLVIAWTLMKRQQNFNPELLKG